MHFRNMLSMHPYTFESSWTTYGKFRYIGRLNVLVFMYLSLVDIKTLSDDYNIAVYTQREFYATKFKITPIFLKFELTDHSEIINGLFTTVFKKYLDKRFNRSIITAADGTQSKSALANAYTRITGEIALIKAKLLQRSNNDFNAYARKALGLCKITYEVISEQSLSEFLIIADDIINSMIGLSVNNMKQINQPAYLGVLEKSLALENELTKFYDLVESEFVMVDQLLQGDFPAGLKFLYDKPTLVDNDCFKTDLELTKKFYVEWTNINCYTSPDAINCLVEAVFIFNIEEIYRIRGLKFHSYVINDDQLYSLSADKFELTIVDCKQRLDFIYYECTLTTISPLCSLALNEKDIINIAENCEFKSTENEDTFITTIQGLIVYNPIYIKDQTGQDFQNLSKGASSVLIETKTDLEIKSSNDVLYIGQNSLKNSLSYLFYTDEELMYLYNSQVFDIMDLVHLNTLYVVLGVSAVALIGIVNALFCHKTRHYSREASNTINVNTRYLRPITRSPPF